VTLLATPAAATPQRLDLYRGSLFTSSRITGLGGAFVGVGLGIDGVYRNPAALATRADDGTSWFDVDFTLDWFLASGDDIDFDADGAAAGASVASKAYHLGISFQFDTIALGVLAAFESDEATTGALRSTTAAADVLIGGAWSLDRGRWIIGGGAAVAALGLTRTHFPGSEDTPIVGDPPPLQGLSFDVGFLHRPRASDWRLGGRLRGPITLGGGGSLVEGHVPWQASLGASVFFGADPERRYNPPHRAHLAPHRDHRYLLVSAEAVLVGPTADGVNVEGFVQGAPLPSGRALSLQLHAGAEGELFENRLRTRVGSYFEPCRLASGPLGRLHVTGGVELRLFEFLFNWKATFAFDVANGFQNLLFGVGFWK
jgi:hypothetical protein